MEPALDIDIFLDPICPWCYIGMRRLRRALAQRPAIPATLRWRPFLLNPDMPMGGMARDAYLLRKFGSEHRVRRLFGALEEHGQSESIDFNFDDIRQTPSTVSAHRLVRFAGDHHHAADVVEALFRAFFVDGRDIGESETLVALAADVGLDASTVREYLDTSTDVAWVEEENAKAHRLGINGVPCYLFDGRFAVQGAQPPDVFVRMLDASTASDDASDAA